jgi:hypothetical protein
VVHKVMAPSARAIARVSGMPDYAFLTVDYPHPPFAAWTADEIAEVAAQLAPQIVAALTRGGQG